MQVEAGFKDFVTKTKMQLEFFENVICNITEGITMLSLFYIRVAK